jgi:glycosyltransferase involved in cell wall biosynthesis
VIAALNSPQIRYSRNERNLGMVGNFNAALSRATGDYVVMITDDDPITIDHSATLRDLALKYPNRGAYFCLGQSFTDNENLARHYRIPVGRTMRPVTSKDREYSARDFVLSFLSGSIEGYMLWSCGMVRRDIAQRVTMPDYGTPYLTDFAYIALAAGDEDVVTKDKIIGWQEIHANNFGRKEFAEIGTALNGFRKLMQERWPTDFCINQASEIFLARWIGGHFGFLLRYESGLRNRLSIFSQYAKLVIGQEMYSGLSVFSLSLLPNYLYQSLRNIKRGMLK